MRKNESQVRTCSFQKVFLKSGLNISSKGFSLIELLVAITIGGIVLTMVMGSYAAMTETNLQLDAARQLQKETNFAVIRMADKIRNFPIDSCEEGELNLQNGAEGLITFSQNAEMSGSPLFSSNVDVQEISFECVGLENSAKLQPRVKIKLEVANKRYPEITNWIQTTISSRIFE